MENFNFFKYLLNSLALLLTLDKNRLLKIKYLNKELLKYKPKKDYIQELFKNIYYIELNYINIKALIDDDNSIFVKKYLYKFPNIIKYENSQLRYIRKNQESINKFSNYFWKFTIILLLIIIAIFLAIIFTTDFTYITITLIIDTFVISIYLYTMQKYKTEMDSLDLLIQMHKNTQKDSHNGG